MRRVAIFGGTFDPVHRGHVEMASELKAHFQLDEMRLVPCHIPPHRPQPVASSGQRLEMLRLAVEDYPELEIDTLELDSPETSYSLKTLQQLREQLGDDVSLSMAMGLDSLAGLSSWYRWKEFLDYGHIIVAARPGCQLPESGELADYINTRLGTRESVRQCSKGTIVVAELSLLDISSTAVRDRLLQGKDTKDLLPSRVCEYLQTNPLYSPHSPQKSQKVSLNG